MSVNYTFENYQVSGCNCNEVAIARKIVAHQKNSDQFILLYLYGESGRGKTHLMYAMVNHLRKNSPESNVKIISTRDFIDEMVEHIRKKRLDQFRDQYTQDLDLLIIEDVDIIAGKEGTQTQLHHILKKLKFSSTKVILTARSHYRDLNVSDSLDVAFDSALILETPPIDLELRIKIMRAKSEEMGLKLSDETIKAVAFLLDGNIAEIEGALLRIDAYFSTMKK